ncbi:MAG: substrate-binding domain-containing protein [Clostridiales bacterium]|nr:sugar ABC transporter substrate-binding protein [Bacillota bacterium]NLL53602.1 substrate-binding domain-containing protein [Clostridiales bacterium]
MKKLLSIVLVLILALALCLPAMAEDFTIAINLKTLSSEYWQNVKAGCDAAAEELGVNIDVQGAAAETEIAEQVAQLETQLAGAPDAVIIAPLDGDAVIGAIESSGYQGIVVFCDTDCAYEGKTSFVGTSNEVAAKQGGDYGVAINGADTKAVIIYGQEGDNTSNLRKSGYEKAVAEAGLELVAQLSGNNTTDGATKVMEDLLNAYPDGINLVLCMNDDTAIGALNAVQAAGVEGINIIGFDGNASAVELIASGDLKATVAQQPTLMGYLAVETALKALQGEAVEANVVVDTVIIDAENCADYLK